jgi:hypothetical protein
MNKDFNDFQKTIRGQFMPSGDELAELAQKELKIKNVEQNFNKYVRELLIIEFELYNIFEKECSIKIFNEAFKRKIFKMPKDNFKESFLDFFSNYYYDFWSLFLSISQSRKTRAGGSFENHLKFLFSKLDFQYVSQTIRNFCKKNLERKMETSCW